MVDPAIYSAIGSGLGYIPSQNINYVDEALMREGALNTLNRAIDWKGFLGSWGVESFATRKFAKLNPAVIITGFYYNLYKGMYDQINENKEHDKDTENTKSE